MGKCFEIIFNTHLLLSDKYVQSKEKRLRNPEEMLMKTLQKDSQAGDRASALKQT